jgi:hypothetical protein
MTDTFLSTLRTVAQRVMEPEPVQMRHIVNLSYAEIIARETDSYTSDVWRIHLSGLLPLTGIKKQDCWNFNRFMDRNHSKIDTLLAEWVCGRN